MRVTLTGTLADLEEFLQNYKSRIEDVKLECTVLDANTKKQEEKYTNSGSTYCDITKLSCWRVHTSSKYKKVISISKSGFYRPEINLSGGTFGRTDTVELDSRKKYDESTWFVSFDEAVAKNKEVGLSEEVLESFCKNGDIDYDRIDGEKWVKLEDLEDRLYILKSRLEQKNSANEPKEPKTDSGKEITGKEGDYFIIDGHLYGKMVDVRKDIGRSDFFIYDHSKRGYIGFEKIKGIKYFSLEDAKNCSEKADKVTKNKKIQKICNTGKTYSGKPYNVLNDGHINVNGIVYATANALAKQYDIELTYIYGYKAVRRERVGKRIFFNCDDFDREINRITKKKVQAQKETDNQTSDDFKVWKLKLSELCRASKMNAGKVYSGAYKKMNRDYGIVFEQLNKDYYNTNGIHARSTLELVYWLETEYNTRCINMFESIVKDMCNKKVYEV